MSHRSSDLWPVAQPAVIGVLALLALFSVLGLWGTQAELSGAIVAGGTVEVESNRQVIQHPDGGVVSAVLVRDGDHVRADDVVVRFSDTEQKSELVKIETQLIEIGARKARVTAEAHGANAIIVPSRLGQMMQISDDARNQVQGQIDLFQARLASHRQELRQIGEQGRHGIDQIAGLSVQLRALSVEAGIMRQELATQLSLLDQGLVPLARITELRREEARISGEIGRVSANVANLRGNHADFEAELRNLRITRKERAIDRLRDLRIRELELQNGRVRVLEALARQSVRAPVAGLVHERQVFTVRSVVQPGEALMQVVPQDQPREIRARVDPSRISEVQRGQRVTLQFPTSHPGRSIEANGQIRTISADARVDDRTGAPYFLVSIHPDLETSGDLNAIALKPGLPVQVFIETRKQTPLGYLIEPLKAYFDRALRES